MHSHPKRRPFFWLLLFLFPTLLANAQSWESLRGLDHGAQLKVQTTDGAESKGRFQLASADAISLETDAGVVSFEKARVRRVQVQSTSRRVRNVVIAAGIGLALGITADQTLGAFFRNEGGQSDGVRAATILGPTGAFAAIAAAFPGYRTVYRVR